MKICRFIGTGLLVALFCFTLVSCDKDENEEKEPFYDPSQNTTDIVVTGMIDAYGCTYADIRGYVNLNLLPVGAGNPEIGIEIRKANSDNSEDRDEDERTTNSLMGNTFNVEFKYLSPSTKYEYRSFVRYGELTYYGDFRTFSTKQPYDVVTTGNASDVTYCSATVTSLISSVDERDNIWIEVIYSTNKESLQNDSAFHSFACSLNDIKDKKEYKITLNNLSDNTTYYYVSVASFNGVDVFSEAKKFTTKQDPFIGTLNGHDWIDLGLPSGIKWATCNIGSSSPEEYGDKYAWGETKIKSDYDLDNYKWSNGSDNGWDNPFTKYWTDNDDGIVDNKTILEPSDDVARVKWGDKWRMPTEEEFRELKNKCRWERTTQDGIIGVCITGPNKHSIFLPYKSNDWLYANYWSASLAMFNSFKASTLFLTKDKYVLLDELRYYGNPVRPVTE